MGYRSEVAYSISFSSDEELASFLAQAKALSGTAVDPHDQVTINNQGFRDSAVRRTWGRMDLALNDVGIKTQAQNYGIPFIAFYQDGVKWYPSYYQEVDAHESLFELAIVNYFNGGQKTTFLNGTTFTASLIACDFLRIGEDDNDVFTKQLGMSQMNGSFGVQRSIWRTETFEKASEV